MRIEKQEKRIINLYSRERLRPLISNVFQLMEYPAQYFGN